MNTKFKIGDRIEINYWSHKTKGTIKEIKNKRIGILKDSTTTGVLTYFSLRKNNDFIEVGYLMYDFGGQFQNK